jgi:hypothetical protein
MRAVLRERIELYLRFFVFYRCGTITSIYKVKNLRLLKNLRWKFRCGSDQQRCAVSALRGELRCRLLLLLLLLLAIHSFTFSFLSLSSLLPIPIFHGVVKRGKLNPCARYCRLHNNPVIFNSLKYFFSQSLISDFVCFVRWLRGRSGYRLVAGGRIPRGQRGLRRFSQGHRRLVPL